MEQSNYHKYDNNIDNENIKSTNFGASVKYDPARRRTGSNNSSM